MARASGARLGELSESRLELGQEVGLGPEMTEVTVALGGLGAHDALHLHPIVAVEGIPLNVGRIDIFAMKDRFESASH